LEFDTAQHAWDRAVCHCRWECECKVLSSGLPTPLFDPYPYPTLITTLVNITHPHHSYSSPLPPTAPCMSDMTPVRPLSSNPTLRLDLFPNPLLDSPHLSPHPATRPHIASALHQTRPLSTSYPQLRQRCVDISIKSTPLVSPLDSHGNNVVTATAPNCGSAKLFPFLQNSH
jgi:hypothetical protein